MAKNSLLQLVALYADASDEKAAVEPCDTATGRIGVSGTAPINPPRDDAL